MKKHILIVAIIVTIITALSGCLSTVHPLFTEKDLLFDSRLLGTWQYEDGNDSISFERGTEASFKQLPPALRKLANKAYVMTAKDDEGEAKYYAFLTRIGNGLYLDYYPYINEPLQDFEPFYMQHIVKMHSFFQLNFNDNGTFTTRQFEGDFLKDLIDKNQIRIKYQKRFDGSYVITAPTEELRQYVLKYGEVSEAYNSKSVVHTRIR